MKKLITNYTFDASEKTITFNGYTTISLSRILVITNVTDNLIIYNFADPTAGGTVASNVLTLDYDTTAMSDTDTLQIHYQEDDPLTAGGANLVGNSRNKFYEPFSVYPLEKFTESKDANDDVRLSGNSYGSSYLNISKSSSSTNTVTSYITNDSFNMPFEMSLGISKSQEIQGQVTVIDFVGVDSDGNIIEEDTIPTAKAISGTTATLTSNIIQLPINDTTIKPGDLVQVYGCLDNRINVGLVQVSYVTRDGQVGIPVTASNGSYTITGGYVQKFNPHQTAKNAYGIILMETSDTNIRTFSKVEGAPVYISAAASFVTNWRQATVGGSGAGSVAQLPRGHVAIRSRVEDVSFYYRPANSSSANTSTNPITVALPPSDDTQYKLRISTWNLDNLTRPVARITSIAKSGSTTATVTTASDHGLSVGNYVSIIGVRDQTNFVATNNIVVASTPTSTTFTTVFGASTTNTNTDGGSVFLCQGSQSAPAVGQYVQSISVSASGAYAGCVQAVLNTTVSGVVRGEIYQLHGLVSALSAYEGIPLRVFEITGSTVVFEALDGSALTTIGSTTSGGTLIRRTNVRLHSLTIRDWAHHKVEIGSLSTMNADREIVRVGLGATATTQSTGVNTTVWNAAGWGGFLVNDVASAAITSTTTTSAVTPGSVATIGTYAHSFNVVITASSGTTPTFDLGVEESIDNGTTWKRIYDFPRFITTGNYSSPLIRSQFGTRFRYVQTISGTTPSFTRSINRIQFSSNAPILRKFFDRVINVNSLSTTTSTYDINGCDSIQLTVNMGAIVTTAPQFQVEGTEDNGATWYSIGSPLVSVASSTVKVNINGELPDLVRVRTSTAGSGATLGYVSLKAVGK